MSELEYAGGTIHLDDEGFLAESEEWNEDVAKLLAEREGLDVLSDDRMDIVRFLRQYYNKYHSFPILNYVCKNVHQPRQCVNEQFVDPMKAWKIAGLPKPEGVCFVTVDGKHYRMERYY